MQHAALLLSGAGAAAAGQRRCARAAPPALTPGGACALYDVSSATLRSASGHAGGRVRVRRLCGSRGCSSQEHQQELEHRGPETEGQEARGRAGTVTSDRSAHKDARQALGRVPAAQTDRQRERNGETLNTNTYKVEEKIIHGPYLCFLFFKKKEINEGPRL